MRGGVVVLGALVSILVIVAFIWIMVDLVSARERLVRPRRSGPGWGEWLRSTVDRRAARRASVKRVSAEREAQWHSFCRKSAETGEWFIGVHRMPLDGDPFDERLMFTIPADGNALERLDREGYAIGLAADFNARREGMGRAW